MSKAKPARKPVTQLTKRQKRDATIMLILFAVAVGVPVTLMIGSPHWDHGDFPRELAESTPHSVLQTDHGNPGTWEYVDDDLVHRPLGGVRPHRRLATTVPVAVHLGRRHPRLHLPAPDGTRVRRVPGRDPHRARRGRPDRVHPDGRVAFTPVLPAPLRQPDTPGVAGPSLAVCAGRSAAEGLRTAPLGPECDRGGAANRRRRGSRDPRLLRFAAARAGQARRRRTRWARPARAAPTRGATKKTQTWASASGPP